MAEPTSGTSFGLDASRNPPLSPLSTSPEQQAKQSTSSTPQTDPAPGSAETIAQPPSSHNLAHNIPLSPLPPLPALPTSSSTPFVAPKRSATTPISPSNKALRFASITGSKTADVRPTDPRRKSGGDVTGAVGGGAKRRASAEQKNNVHTRSGRHGDEWLFGGWKRLWGDGPKKEDPKGGLK